MESYVLFTFLFENSFFTDFHALDRYLLNRIFIFSFLFEHILNENLE